MSKIKCIGIVAEDKSDFEASTILIKRILNKSNIPFKKAVGNGCGKLKRKASDYAVDLKKRGCDMLILIHDLDRNDLNKLTRELAQKLANAPIKEKFICIPVEELEAWFFSDLEGLQKLFKLKRRPKITGNPETIRSPKEKLEEVIYSCSDKSVIYLNTEHNKKIAEVISIDLMKNKCNSFRLLYDFVKAKRY